MKFSKAFKNSISNKISHKTTIRTGEITADNGDGTYDVKISNADSATPDVETMYYNDIFSVGEIVDIGFEYGNKESPKILGHSKKIAQEPAEVEVDYSGSTGGSAGSGGSGGGLQTKTITVYSNPEDMTIEKLNPNYNIAHDAMSGTYLRTAFDYMLIGQFYVTLDPEGLNYVIDRSMLHFDASAIPINANIITAILYLRKADINQDDPFNVVIQDGQPNYPHATPILSDYNKEYYHNNGGQKAADSFSDSAYTAIPLNPNGINWINKGGLTKFCLRSSRDIAKLSPEFEGTFNSIVIWASEKDEGYKPKLEITYTI